MTPEHEEAVRLARKHGRVAGKQDFPSAGFTMEGLAALIADVRSKRTDEICSLIRPMLPIGDVSAEYATGHAHAIYEAENLIRARLEEGK